MKYSKIVKTISIVLSFVLVFGIAVNVKAASTKKDDKANKPEIDLSGMSYEELAELKDQISLAMWDSEEWQEVTVPQGTWIVGEDIPAGHWTIKCADVNRNDRFLDRCEIEWGYVDKYGMIQFTANVHGRAKLFNPNSNFYKRGTDTEMDINLDEGMAIIIDNHFAPAVFCPYFGKESLGFK
ncbi:MAG: hypothetical protein IJH81_05860 [Lachnospiraceae bacterium]|nr:hypothetical protein [Lachnospiraceae bacterium]MBQ6635872.1 hypothetical protein [Lachnospiraceae bacterium]